jgi:hypothetical protein
MEPTDTTAGSTALRWRLTMVWKAMITCAAMGSGSMPVCG